MAGAVAFLVNGLLCLAKTDALGPALTATKIQKQSILPRHPNSLHCNLTEQAQSASYAVVASHTPPAIYSKSQLFPALHIRPRACVCVTTAENRCSGLQNRESTKKIVVYNTNHDDQSHKVADMTANDVKRYERFLCLTL